MLRDLFEDRIRRYSPANPMEQELVLQDIVQQQILVSLSRAGFFKQAIFHGSTCLHIFYKLGGFSEDLDFLLRRPDTAFSWDPFVNRIRNDCEAEGMKFEAKDKSTVNGAVKKVFLKTDSIGTLIFLDLPYSRNVRRKLRIKLEVDANPPMCSGIQTHFLTFPGPASVTTQDLPSGFATKAHALLCRKYVKGRDWYDFLWYVDREVIPNFPLLRNAIEQSGPWAGQSIEISPPWFVQSMRSRIEELDWKAVREDVSRFLPHRDQEGLALWTSEYFLYHLEKLASYLQ